MAVDANSTPAPDSETIPNDAGLAICPFCSSPNVRCADSPKRDGYETVPWEECGTCDEDWPAPRSKAVTS